MQWVGHHRTIQHRTTTNLDTFNYWRADQDLHGLKIITVSDSITRGIENPGSDRFAIG
jgi:hypothetical protein